MPAVNLPSGGATQVVDCFFHREGDSDLGPVDAAHRALVEQVVEVDRPSSSATSRTATSTPASCTRRWSRRCAKAT